MVQGDYKKNLVAEAEYMKILFWNLK